jgi:hypothetical protein
MDSLGEAHLDSMKGGGLGGCEELGWRSSAPYLRRYQRLRMIREGPSRLIPDRIEEDRYLKRGMARNINLLTRFGRYAISPQDNIQIHSLLRKEDDP